MSEQVISPSAKKALKEYEDKSPKTYEELAEQYQTELSELMKRKPGKTAAFYENRSLFQVKKGLRGRTGAAMVRIQAISLYATPIFDIAGKRRYAVINSVKDAVTKGEENVIEELITSNQLVIKPMAEFNSMIDEELAKLEGLDPIEDTDRITEINGNVNFFRRQKEDGTFKDKNKDYVILPLETREFFDDAGTRKNPNFGNPMNYADRRRIFLLGRTVTSKEVGLPTLLVVEARLDQCYNFNAKPWTLVEGFDIRVRRGSTADVTLLSTSRSTEWKVKTEKEMADLLAELEVPNISESQHQVSLLLSGKPYITTIDEIWEMYGTAEWTKLMSNYDRFTIVVADLMTKLDFPIGFMEQFLAEGTTPESTAFESKAMNFWVGKDQEDQWKTFGNGSRIVFAGQLVDRNIWDEEAGAISDETAPALAATCFTAVPEYLEEPEG